MPANALSWAGWHLRFCAWLLQASSADEARGHDEQSGLGQEVDRESESPRALMQQYPALCVTRHCCLSSGDFSPFASRTPGRAALVFPFEVARMPHSARCVGALRGEYREYP